MNKKGGSILVIVLISVALVTGLALSSGAIMRSRLAISKNILKRMELRNDAFSALAQSIVVINSDTNGVDYLDEKWNQLPEYGASTVSIRDELSCIRFQSAGQELLRALFNNATEREIDAVAEVQSKLLVAWWKKETAAKEDRALSSYEELFNVPMANASMLLAVSPYITIYGEGKMNINTVSEVVFTAFLNGAGYTGEHVSRLYARLVRMRERGDYFEKLDMMEARRLLAKDGNALSAQELIILESLREKVCTDSGIFRIRAVAKSNAMNYTIECVYKRDTAEFLKWVEW